MKFTLKKKWKWATLDPNGKNPHIWIRKPMIVTHCGQLGFDNRNSQCEEIPDFISHDLKPGECRRINK